MRVSVSVRVVQFQFLCFACCIIMSELLDSMMTTMVNTIKNEKQKKKTSGNSHMWCKIYSKKNNHYNR